MYQLAVLYAPDRDDYSDHMEELGRAFEKLNFDVTLRGARDAGITDILAADVVIFCSDLHEGQSLHPDFTEMVRAFGGINLAGKFSGFVSLDGSHTPELFRKALHDTGIGTYSDDLIFSGRVIKPKDMKIWAKALYKGFKECVHE